MKKLIVVLLFTILSAGCANLGKYHNEHGDFAGKEVVIFVPGYKGSKLVDKNTNETVWLTLEEILFGDHSLKLESNDPLVPTGILETLAVLPPFYSIDIYEDCLEEIKALNSGYKLIVFPFDWRQSNIKTAEKLKRFIDDLNSKGAKSISIIAHSMGGLPVSYMLSSSMNVAPIKNIVFLTVPFRGTVTAFIDMQREISPILNNDKLLNRRVFNTFESAYEFLPHPSDHTFNDISDDNSKTLFDVNRWKSNSWGMFKDPNLRNDSNSNIFLEENLNRSLKMYRTIDLDKTVCPTNKIVNIIGMGNPVKASVTSNFMDNIDEIDKNEKVLTQQDGDILITVDSAKLPSSFKVCSHQEIVIDRLIHDRACNHPTAMKEIKNGILN